MERVIQWILKLEQQLDREESITSNDLKLVKEQFQKHEVKKIKHEVDFLIIVSFFFLN